MEALSPQLGGERRDHARSGLACESSRWVEADPNQLWNKLKLLERCSVEDGSLDAYWETKKALGPASVVRVLFCEEVLTVIRRELNRNAPARLEMSDVFGAVREALSKESLLEAG